MSTSEAEEGGVFSFDCGLFLPPITPRPPPLESFCTDKCSDLDDDLVPCLAELGSAPGLGLCVLAVVRLRCGGVSCR